MPKDTTRHEVIGLVKRFWREIQGGRLDRDKPDTVRSPVELSYWLGLNVIDCAHVEVGFGHDGRASEVRRGRDFHLEQARTDVVVCVLTGWGGQTLKHGPILSSGSHAS